MKFRILYQDPYLVAIDKPAGFHVHPPEDPSYRISNQTNCLWILKNQLNTYLYPVHRLDRATSGVLLFALQKEAAKGLNLLFTEKRIKKTYFCVTRGWIKEKIELSYPLDGLEAQTTLTPVGHQEFSRPVGKYATARYTFLQAEPHTGKMHQIRRHCAHLSHPLIGDSIYGDGAHNRFFKTDLNISGLLLKAYQLNFIHPMTSQTLCITSKWDSLWHRTFDQMGVCGWKES